MYKGINIITNEGLGFKLTNSTSFGESVFSAGFIQKTANGATPIISNCKLFRLF